jgi:hypothetical protein
LFFDLAQVFTELSDIVPKLGEKFGSDGADFFHVRVIR